VKIDKAFCDNIERKVKAIIRATLDLLPDELALIKTVAGRVETKDKLLGIVCMGVRFFCKVVFAKP